LTGEKIGGKYGILEVEGCRLMKVKKKAATGFHFFCDSRYLQDFYLRHFRSQYLQAKETDKLTMAPIAASTIVLTKSPALILTKSIVMIPPRVP
jgi:hypothetical protein